MPSTSAVPGTEKVCGCTGRVAASSPITIRVIPGLLVLIPIRMPQRSATSGGMLRFVGL